MGSFLQGTPQSKDGGSELKEVQERLFAAELKVRKTEELRKEEVATLELTIQILQQKEVIQVIGRYARYTIGPMVSALHKPILVCCNVV